MREDTQKLLKEVATLENISDFLFVGGTALAYQVNHRVSEDLDFGFLGFKLPEAKIKDILNKLSKSHKVSLQTDYTAIQEAENEGVNLLEHQQDWLVDDVKVTFFSLGEDDMERRAIAGFPTEKYGKVNVLGLDGLFFTKCLVLTKRIKSRDIYDIWWFTKNGKTIEEVFNTIQSTYPHLTYESIRYRLLDWQIPATDEGLEPVNTQLGIDEVRSELREQVRALENQMAMDHVSHMRPGFK